MATTSHARRQRAQRFAALSLTAAHGSAHLTAYDVPAPPLPADESEPGRPEPWQAVSPLRPDTADVRAPRFLDATGEVLAAAIVVIGGMIATGFASLIG